MFKLLPKSHKTIPNFPLHSTHSYKTFLKTHPKHILKLEIDPNMATVYNSEKIKRILLDLTKLTKKSRNIKAIQDISLLKHFRARKSQTILTMKRLHRIESLGVMWNLYEMKIQKETRMWLKYINRLRSLSFRNTHVRTRPSLKTIESFKKFNMRLLQEIHQRKITKLIHSPWHDSKSVHHYVLDTRFYPESMQEISLGLDNCIIVLGNGHVEKLISMERFSFLRRLELLFCLELEMALMTLQSIPNPQNLSSLGLHLRNFFPEDNEQSIFEFISNKCLGLDRLDLRLTHPTEKLENLRLISLRVLNLWVTIKTEKHLEDLGLFLLAAKNLESLNLTIDFDLGSTLCQENFLRFYKALGQLSKLRKLFLDFSPNEKTPTWSTEYIQYYKVPPSYPALMESITCLSQLEELCLEIPDIESELKANQLGESLNGQAHQLKRLEVDFYGQSLDDVGFINVLRKMKALRELCIHRFSLTEKNIFLDFKEALESLDKIEKVVLRSFEIPLKTGEILNDIVLFLLMKKGMKELRVKHNSQGCWRKAKKEVPFAEILKRNPELRLVNIESPNIWYTFFNNQLESLRYV